VPASPWKENRKAGEHLEDQNVDGRIILRSASKCVWRTWSVFICIRIGTVADYCGYDNEMSG